MFLFYVLLFDLWFIITQPKTPPSQDGIFGEGDGLNKIGLFFSWVWT